MASPDKATSRPDGEQKPAAPSISLPKGGGAIRGIGEKFAANPVTGTGSMSVPIATSPGRSGFGPQLSLSYDSGSGNGPFGFGWSLSLPSITRKTDKGLPRYQDADESDVFILSGAEDLVPVLIDKGNGKWEREQIPRRTVGGKTYRIQRYRPRIEGLFARIERWTNEADPGDTFWRSISKDNITTWYGKSAESRIADPGDSSPVNPTRVFSWLICESHDDKGNVIVYRYEKENSENVDLSQAHERNRGDKTSKIRSANRYLKRIRYGNYAPYFPELAKTKPWPTPPGAIDPDGSKDWFFEVVFDYGEHDQDRPMPDEPGKKWPRRNDPFSTYRAGFEVRTYRLCQRVLMFHHFPNEQDVGANYLVRSTDFTYSYEQDPASAQNPIYSFLLSVTQWGYKRRQNGYLKKSLPPVEFEYTQPIVQDAVEDVDPTSLENLPMGLDGATYQWTDLHGEGIPGVLTEQAGGWFYKRNLSPIPVRDNGSEFVKARLAPVELVASKPNVALAGGQAQFMDLAGDGQPDVVVMDGPVAGLYEHDDAEGWQSFRPFTSCLNRDTRDPNLKFVDLDGDGHADALITEDDAFVWHASLAEEGFGPACRVAQALDEEKGPRIVFADGTQSIYLADLSGDGLADIVRIRNGEVCYWPNLGYGHFGAKVTTDNAPWFDHCDQFDHKRIRLADIDGSGTTDIIYLHRDGVRIYFNQSGNSWSQPHLLKAFPRIDDVVSIVPIDLLGNGTACLVWSSPLPGDARRPMHYIKLMGEQKPHLLVKTVNNLGAETKVNYAPSTKFYLADKQAGKPWITRLPFPVHVVEKVTVTDTWRKTRFSSTYSYHHGYFDGIEREFRGFGRVEQVDVETFGTFEKGNEESPYITKDKTLYQPPIKTVTWFHTGAFLDRDRILSHFEKEYFPRWLEDRHPDLHIAFQENPLPQPDLETENLSAEEWREALRACKGMMLRQEVVELDIDALERPKDPEQLPVKLFSTAYHNCHIRRLQPRDGNRHAVFLVAESEAITYHYELDIRESEITKLSPDPRIAHTLNLQYDEYGNVLQSVAAVYRRLVQHQDSILTEDQLEKIHEVQGEPHLAYTESRYTDDEVGPDTYRLRMPCAVKTYELTGIVPTNGGSYFDIDHLRGFRLSTRYQRAGTPVTPLAYHEQPSGTGPHQRLVEHLLTRYFKDDLSGPLAFGRHGTRGLTYETYKLALTSSLLDEVFGAAKLTPEVLAYLRDKTKSGYLYLANTIAANVFDDEAAADQYWICSGTAGFEPDAPQHFYLPERYTDPFRNVTTLKYDPNDLFIESSTDPAGNVVTVDQFDFRVLAPRRLKDINENLSEVVFDTLGMPTAMALLGKGSEADNLVGFDEALTNPDPDTINRFFTQDYSETEARRLLGNATVRHLYYFGEKQETNGTITWGAHPACAAGLLRERHVAQLAADEHSPLQAAFEYSDGMGAAVVKKAQAEPEEGSAQLRWIASGKTILNNKGKPVKQYEPYFSAPAVGHRFEEPLEVGVTPIMYYDAPGRLIRTELPDGSFSRVEFSPWHVRSFDQNDTVKESRWYRVRLTATERGVDPLTADPDEEHLAGNALSEDKRAARLAAVHSDTPALTILDSLGREVITIAHNKFIDRTGVLNDEKYLTFTKLDAEGKPLWIRDARKDLVMQYITPPKPNNDPSDAMPTNAVPCYDIAGNLLYQHSMDAGDRWMLMDAAGKPMYGWDVNDRHDGTGTAIAENRILFTSYDRLHRPTEISLTINNGPTQVVERFVYVDGPAGDHTKNLRGQLREHYDQSGLTHVGFYDFKGKPREIRRQVAADYKAPVLHWPAANPTAGLEAETFVQITEYDALSRMTRLYNWHRGTGSRVAVYEPQYSRRGVLVSEDLVVEASKTATGYTEPPGSRRNHAITSMTYDAKGQRQSISYGNNTVTRYHYDPQTFRLLQLRTTRQTINPEFPNRVGLKDPDILQNLYYTYDPVGNITEIVDDAIEPAFFKNQKIEAKSQYSYDALYRLLSGTGRENGQGLEMPGPTEQTPMVAQFPIIDPNALRNYTEHYRYDAVGNIKEMSHVANGGSWTRHYEYAADSNRLLKTWEGDNVVGAVQYRYDTHGSMLNYNNVAPGQFLQWDYRDMIQALDLVGGGRVYYTYDSGKQRTRKVSEVQTGARRWERIDLGGFEVFRRYSGATVVEEIETLHLVDGDRRVLLVDDVRQTDNAQLGVGVLYRYQYGNHLGSVGVELDDQAQIISYEDYHPYGTSSCSVVSKTITATAKRYRFTGKERDGESRLYYHGARYYAPWLGRWISADPAGLVDGTNVYAYARNNPCMFIDPSGTQKERLSSMEERTLNSTMNWVQGELARLQWESALKGEVQPKPMDPGEPLPPPAAKPNKTPQGFGTMVTRKLVDAAGAKVEEAPNIVLSPARDLLHGARTGGLGGLANTALKLELKYMPFMMIMSIAAGVGEDISIVQTEAGRAVDEPNEEKAAGHTAKMVSGIVGISMAIILPEEGAPAKVTVSQSTRWWTEGALNAAEMESALRPAPNAGFYELVFEGGPVYAGETVDYLDALQRHVEKKGKDFRGITVYEGSGAKPQTLGLEEMRLRDPDAPYWLNREPGSMYKLGGGYAPFEVSEPLKQGKPAFTLLNPVYYPSARAPANWWIPKK